MYPVYSVSHLAGGSYFIVPREPDERLREPDEHRAMAVVAVIAVIAPGRTDLNVTFT